jgi:cell fate (sporulation/competence/biofilm development) regulator YmcA (YheA/YmcA/DUF963 family)
LQVVSGFTLGTGPVELVRRFFRLCEEQLRNMSTTSDIMRKMRACLQLCAVRFKSYLKRRKLILTRALSRILAEQTVNELQKLINSLS